MRNADLLDRRRLGGVRVGPDERRDPPAGDHRIETGQHDRAIEPLGETGDFNHRRGQIEGHRGVTIKGDASTSVSGVRIGSARSAVSSRSRNALRMRIMDDG